MLEFGINRLNDAGVNECGNGFIYTCFFYLLYIGGTGILTERRTKIMQKLSYAVLNKLIKSHATSAEIDVLLYVSRYQNEHGVAEGMYYRSICEELGFAYQTFYDVKESLVQKNIISVRKRHYSDHDITILDNDFSSPEAFEKGYVNTNHKMFSCSQFRALKAGAKLLAMDLFKNNLAGNRSYHCNTKEFFKKYTEKYDICKRTLQEYLKELRLLFSIGVKDKQYWITVRAFAKERQEKKEEQKFRDNCIDVAVRRNRIKNTRKEDLKELDKMLSIYNKEIKETFENFSFSTVVESSIERLNPGVPKKNWERKLKPNLIHRLLKKALDLPVRDLTYDPINA